MKKKNIARKDSAEITPAHGLTGGTAAPLPAYEQTRVPHGRIAPDADQPRKVFAEAALDEMAESLHRQGILQDLILEYVPAKYRLQAPDLTTTDWHVEERREGGGWVHAFQAATEVQCQTFAGAANLADGFRIVCGERRWRGAGRTTYTNAAGDKVTWAGLQELPARVYTGLTAQQRFALQWTENEQRVNISALEEAGALAQQLEERKRSEAGFSPETLAAEIGISRAGLYEKLKLNRLQPAIREALVAGTISVSVAGEIAKLPTPKMQGALLKEIMDLAQHKYRPTTLSVRAVQQRIEEDYLKDLKGAPFWKGEEEHSTFNIQHSTSSGEVSNGEALPACGTCPHRTGNMVAEFPELKAKPNWCCNPECHGLKCKAHWTRTAQDLAQKGQTVMTEKEFRAVKGKYLAGDKQDGETGWSTLEHVMGKHKPEPVLVATAEGLEEYYAKEEAVAAAKQNGQPLKGTRSKEEEAEAKTKSEAGQKLHDARCALAASLVKEAAAGLEQLSDRESWALLAEETNSGWGPFHAAIKKLVKGNRGRVLAGEMAQKLTRVAEWNQGAWDKKALALWKRLGVDLEAEEAKRAPKPELPLKTEAKQPALKGMSAALQARRHRRPPRRAKQPALKGMSAAGKARIMAAQRARWAKITRNRANSK